MRNILLIVLIFISACDTGSLEYKKEKVDKLKNSLDEIYSEIDRLEKEINELDSTFGVKNYELISTINPYNDGFIHQIDLRGNVKSKMNVLIVSEVVGRYKKINVKEGQFVEKGTVLAVINSDVIDNNLKEIETNLKLLKTIYDRQSNLWENNIGSELDYLRAKSNYESLKSRFDAVKLQASRFKIIAPMPGIIDAINAKVGEMSSPAMPAFRIYNDNDSYINIDVSENYIESFQVGDTVKVISSKNSTFESLIISIGQVINPDNRTFNIGVDIPESYMESFKPNQIVNVLLVDYKNNNSTSLPSNIIYSDDKGSYVFIVEDFDGEKVARKIPVLVGKSFNYKTEILSGLVGNEKVIDKGSSQVMDGSYVKIKN